MARRPKTTSQVDSLAPTVLEHIREFRARLFWVVGTILVTSSAGYLIKDQLLALLTKPLGEQQLYYLTPVGGLSFIVKLSLYFGFLVTVPLIVYHLFRYLQPLMNGQQRSVVRYLLFSCVLAACGVGFAYFVSLPAALHFLTDFNLNQITAMLTVDAYLTFVTSYLLGAVVLFQIPLVLLIIDKITPLTPRGLMGYQRHVILVAFIAAAIISPTPDVINQALLALPIIVMYQFGIVLIWVQTRQRKRAAVPNQAVKESVYRHVPQTASPALPIRPFVGAGPRVEVTMPAAPRQVATTKQKPIKTRTIRATASNMSMKPATPAKLIAKPIIADLQQPAALVAPITPSAPDLAPPVATITRPQPAPSRAPQPLSRSLIPDRRVRLERTTQRLASIDGIIS